MATAAAAVAARARRVVEQFFFDKSAFDADRAVEFDPQAPIQRRYLEQLIAQGVVHEVEPGCYWLDQPAYKEMRHRQFVWGIRILALGAVVVIVLLTVQVATHQR